MNVHDLLDTIDNAEATVVEQAAPKGRLVAVWHGGTTVNVYTVSETYASEVGVFNTSNDDGRPLPRKEMMAEMRKDLVQRRKEATE